MNIHVKEIFSDGKCIIQDVIFHSRKLLAQLININLSNLMEIINNFFKVYNSWHLYFCYSLIEKLETHDYALG
jgi:regulator of RNase E activity RraB